MQHLQLGASFLHFSAVKGHECVSCCRYYPKAKHKKETFIGALTCPLHSCVLLESFSDNTDNLACGTLIMALERKDLQVLHIQTWVSAKKEVSSFDSRFVIKHQPDVIFALLTVRQTDFSTHIWLKKPQSSQREVLIIAVLVSILFIHSGYSFSS